MGPPPHGVVLAGPLVIDLLADTATVDGRRLHLSAGEWALLAVLARSLGRVVSWADLRTALWPSVRAHAGLQADAPSSAGTMRALAYRTRSNLGRCAGLLATVPGVGLVLRESLPEGR
jgi:DNA-binding response OmpR family regulator